MSKKTIVIILLSSIIIAGIASAIFIFQKQKNNGVKYTEQNKNENPDEKKAAEEKAEEEKVKKIIEQSNEIYGIAKKDHNANKCAEMPDEERKDRCVKLIAIDIINSELCEKIINDKIKKECYDEVYYKDAVE
ncbi:MAG: hypothetical protein V1860_03305, partial [bacterium]